VIEVMLLVFAPIIGNDRYRVGRCIRFEAMLTAMPRCLGSQAPEGLSSQLHR